MKQDEGALDPIAKRRESEFFHGKALDIAAGFLPSECPLVNHILMSYQKHHAPSQQVIQEGEEYEEDLKIIRPLQGIESNKHQPIVRANHDLNISIVPITATPIIYKNHHERILKLQKFNFLEPKVAVTQSSSKNTQTAQVQTITQYQSSSSGASTNVFSMKNPKKMINNGTSFIKKKYVLVYFKFTENTKEKSAK